MPHSEYLIWMILEGESSKSPLHLLFRRLLEQAQHPRVVLPLPPHIAPKLPILLTGGISLLPSAELSVIRAWWPPTGRPVPTHKGHVSHLLHADKEFGELPFLSFHRSSFDIKTSKGLIDDNIRPTQGFQTLYCSVLSTTEPPTDFSQHVLT